MTFWISSCRQHDKIVENISRNCCIYGKTENVVRIERCYFILNWETFVICLYILLLLFLKFSVSQTLCLFGIFAYSFRKFGFQWQQQIKHNYWVHKSCANWTNYAILHENIDNFVPKRREQSRAREEKKRMKHARIAIHWHFQCIKSTPIYRLLALQEKKLWYYHIHSIQS